VILPGLGEKPAQDLVEQLESLAQQTRPPSLLRVEPQGRPLAEVIAEVAGRTRADLIVIGSPGPGPLPREPLIQAVVASCSLPVHVVPERYDPEADRWGWLEAAVSGRSG
jgi:nucleotide-binding universal stress UspA family protein